MSIDHSSSIGGFSWPQPPAAPAPAPRRRWKPASSRRCGARTCPAWRWCRSTGGGGSHFWWEKWRKMVVLPLLRVKLWFNTFMAKNWYVTMLNGKNRTTFNRRNWRFEQKSWVRTCFFPGRLGIAFFGFLFALYLQHLEITTVQFAWHLHDFGAKKTCQITHGFHHVGARASRFVWFCNIWNCKFALSMVLAGLWG